METSSNNAANNNNPSQSINNRCIYTSKWEFQRQTWLHKKPQNDSADKT
jgi:hypothetical protein